jgi:hypothetical protein
LYFTDEVDNDCEYIIVESVEAKILTRNGYGILWCLDGLDFG